MTNKKRFSLKGILKTMLSYLPLTALLFLPCLALADAGASPVGQGITYIIDQMYGADGAAIATIAMMAVGLLCMTHILQWKSLVLTIMGISMIFGAGAIVAGIQALVSNN